MLRMTGFTGTGRCGLLCVCCWLGGLALFFPANLSANYSAICSAKRVCAFCCHAQVLVHMSCRVCWACHCRVWLALLVLA